MLLVNFTLRSCEYHWIQYDFVLLPGVDLIVVLPISIYFYSSSLIYGLLNSLFTQNAIRYRGTRQKEIARMLKSMMRFILYLYFAFLFLGSGASKRPPRLYSISLLIYLFLFYPICFENII